jgi:Mu-like prophage tail sheath protein gpL
VDGGIKAGEVATVNIGDRTYTYTVTADDSLASVRDNLIAAINADPEVIAYPAGSFTRIRLRSKTAGKAGEGLAYSASMPDGSSLILTPLSTALCCASTAGAPITVDNPAVPGETIIIYATGLGPGASRTRRSSPLRRGASTTGPS